MPTTKAVTKEIIVRGHGTSESGEPFVRLEIEGKRVLVRVNHLLVNRNAEFARLQNHGARLLQKAAQEALTTGIDAELRKPASFTVATTLGWHGEVFVFPDTIVPKGWSDVEIYLDGRQCGYLPPLAWSRYARRDDAVVRALRWQFPPHDRRCAGLRRAVVPGASPGACRGAIRRRCRGR